MAFFTFKHVFTSCSATSAEGSHEFDSGTLCNVGTLFIIFGSSGVLISFSDENERRIRSLLSPLFTVDVCSVSSEFDVKLNLFETSAIVLNVPAGCLARCIMGNVNQQCRVHVTWKDWKFTTSPSENAVTDAQKKTFYLFYKGK